MAKFTSGEKASKKDAEESLRAHAAAIYDGVFDVKFESDDGGNMITLYLEVEEPSEQLDPFIHDALWSIKWKGWRFIITKCPPGYIDAVLNSTVSDDW
jgi:hypothetical protein